MVAYARHPAGKRASPLDGDLLAKHGAYAHLIGIKTARKARAGNEEAGADPIEVTQPFGYGLRVTIEIELPANAGDIPTRLRASAVSQLRRRRQLR